MWKITQHRIASHHTVSSYRSVHCTDRKRKMVLYSSSMRLLWMLAENSCKQSIKWMTSRYLHRVTKPGMIQWCRISLGKCVCAFVFVYGLFIHYVQYDHKILKLNNQPTKRKRQKEMETQLRAHTCHRLSISIWLLSPAPSFVRCLWLLS